MSIEDCEAICPKCGHHISFETAHKNPNRVEITDIKFHCTKCGWKEPWKKEGGIYGAFVKQPPLKKIRKIFAIEYKGAFIENFNAKNIRKILNDASQRTDYEFVKVEEINPYLLVPKERKKIEVKFIPEIVKTCRNCGRGIAECERYPKCTADNLKDWKPIEPEKPKFERDCNNCGWFAENIYKCNSKKDCNKYSEWKPIEEEKTTKFPEHGKNYTFSDKTEKK